jgi:biopolymer transport protein ExbD
MANDKSITIVVTSENIVYVNNRVTTLQELRGLLSQAKDRASSVLIKADRRASVGRIVDIWNLGRNLGIKRINVATDQEE